MRSVITIFFAMIFLSACGPTEVTPMYSPVNTAGNTIQADTGPQNEDLNDEFCPPGEAELNNC